MRKGRESGQAAVESALTLPLVLFMVLGTMQLFLALQARILAQHAIQRAVRQGSLHFANCEVMRGTAITHLIPAIQPFAKPGTGFATKNNKLRNHVKSIVVDGGFTYSQMKMPNYSSQVIWLERLSPLAGDVSGIDIEDEWDRPPPQGQKFELSVRMIFWYPLRIPFANWVLAHAVLAGENVQDYTAQNPYLLTQKANWQQGATPLGPDKIRTEFKNRVNRQEYVLPIQTSAVMRMMTPPRARFLNMACAFP